VTCPSEVVRALGQITVQKVESAQNGPSGQCDLGLTTFQDDPNNKTYCLSDPMLGNG
jgi:hypothetical protein